MPEYFIIIIVPHRLAFIYFFVYICNLNKVWVSAEGTLELPWKIRKITEALQIIIVFTEKKDVPIYQLLFSNSQGFLGQKSTF